MLSIFKSSSLLSRRSLLSTSSKAFISTAPQAGSKGSNNEEPRHSYTPYWLGGVALALLGGYYAVNNKDPPQIGAVSSIDRAMAPKTEGANVDGQDPSTGYQKRH